MTKNNLDQTSSSLPNGFAKSTDFVHHPYRPPESFRSAQEPVYAASTVFLESIAAARAYDWKEKNAYSYGLGGTPSTFILEERIAALEGGLYCSLYPSGLAAIANANLAFLQSGDEVLIPENSYGPTVALVRQSLTKFGITHQIYDPMSPTDLAHRINPRTQLVWMEAAGSGSMEFPPLPELIALCKKHQVLSILDNTWGAGLAFNAFELGVDLTVHALTKYPCGGGDVLMGSITTRNQELHLQSKHARGHYGWGVSGMDVAHVLKGLASMELRYRAQDASARKLAQFLQQQPAIAAVLHPALSGEKTNSESYQNWRSVCGSCQLAAGIFSVVFQNYYTQAQVDQFCESLLLFKLGYSWGGPVSLAMTYDMPAARPIHATAWKNQGPLVRLAIGLEATDDLQADLVQALGGLAGK